MTFYHWLGPSAEEAAELARLEAEESEAERLAIEEFFAKAALLLPELDATDEEG